MSGYEFAPEGGLRAKQDFPPGTVAKATVRGHEDVLVFKDDSRALNWTSALGVETDASSSETLHNDGDLTDIRPLVVLDLNDTSLRRVVEVLREKGLDLIADQIEAQTKKPRPPEPTGLGAVVALRTNYTWSRAVRTPGSIRPWQWLDSSGNGGPAEWEHLDPIEVLTEGWTE